VRSSVCDAYLEGQAWFKQKVRNLRDLVVLFGTPNAAYVENVMTGWATFAVLVIWPAWIPAGAQSSPAVESANSQQQPKTDPQARPEPKGEMTSLTGCMDEQEGQWVLVNDQTLAILANLAADGFPTEGFAKHMGHKVTVRGTVSSGGSRPLFKVRSIETISETCASR
jgi:hypothetical protein